MKKPPILEKLNHEGNPQVPVRGSSKSPKKPSQSITPKTYSLLQKNIDYITSVAFQLGQKRGKIISASEALRAIIDQHEGKIKR